MEGDAGKHDQIILRRARGSWRAVAEAPSPRREGGYLKGKIKSDRLRNPCWPSTSASHPQASLGSGRSHTLQAPGSLYMPGFLLRVPFLAYPPDELLFLDLFQLVLRDNIAGLLHVTHRNDCSCPCISHSLAVSPPGLGGPHGQTLGR